MPIGQRGVVRLGRLQDERRCGVAPRRDDRFTLARLVAVSWPWSLAWTRHLGHRKITHRPVTATVFTAVMVAVWAALLLLGASEARWPMVTIAVLAGWRLRRMLGRRGWCWVVAAGFAAGVVALGPDRVAWLALAPAVGWWSHLAGDALFGRIPVGRRGGVLLARVLPTRFVRRSREGWLVGVGWDTDGLLERGHRRLPERDPVTGLHKTVRVLPFAPTTLALQATTVVLGFACALQAKGGV